MWDCTLTSPREGTHFGGLPISTSASPRKRSPGESCWATFADSTTPLEQQHSPVKEYSDRRDFKLVGGRLACKLCDDNVLRTVAGHDLHVRKMHDQLEVYSSYGGEESEAGGRVNPNVPKGRETHRAGLLRELKALGVTTKELAAEGYHLDELKKAGYTVKELRASGKWGLDELKGGGVTRHLKAAGATIKDLLGAGYSLAELKRAGFCCKVLRGSGDKARTLADLRAAGFSLHELREAGFGLKELKELKRPGSGHEPAFTLQDLKAEGFTCANLRRAGFALHDLKAGYTQDELKRSPCMCTHTCILMCMACAFHVCRYTQDELKMSSATTKAELAGDGFSLRELVVARYSALELRGVGFSNAQLTAVGFTKGDINMKYQ